MKTTLGILMAAVAIAAPAAAQKYGGRPIARGTPVVVIGQISSQPRDYGFFHEGKMQVAVGPELVDHTLHLDGAMIYDRYDREIAKSDLLDKW